MNVIASSDGVRDPQVERVDMVGRFGSEALIRSVVVGLGRRVHSYQLCVDEPREKSGPPIGPLTPSWREGISITVLSGHGRPLRGRGTD
jgi:hypothetical protein